jgi:hypothetical protein
MVLYPVTVCYNVRDDNTKQYNALQYTTIVHIKLNNTQMQVYS